MDKSFIKILFWVIYTFILVVLLSSVIFGTSSKILKLTLSGILFVMLLPFIVAYLDENILNILLVLSFPFMILGCCGNVIGIFEKLFIIFAVIMLAKVKPEFSITKYHLFIFLFILYLILNYNIIGTGAFYGYANMLRKLVVVYIVGIIVYTFFNPKHIYRMLLSVGIFFLINGIYGISQVILKTTTENMAIGFSGHHNAFALHSLLGFSVWFVLFIHEKKKNRKVFYLIFFIIEIFAIILSLSRSVWIVLASFFFVLAWKDANYRKYLIVILLVIVISLSFMPDFVVKRFDTLINMKSTFSNVYKEDQVSEVTRFFLTMAGFKMFLKKPIFGWGVGQFVPNWNNFSGIYYKFSVNPHNEYIRILSETGIVGMILFLLFIIPLINSMKEFDRYKYCINDKYLLISEQILRYFIIFMLFINVVANTLVYNKAFYLYIFMILLLYKKGKRYCEEKGCCNKYI